MNRSFRNPLSIIIVIFAIYAQAQNIQDTSAHRFRLVDGLDSMNIQTGDLLLFQSTTFDGIMTQIGTIAPYTHTAMVLRDSDGTLWLTHATDNVYEGVGIPVRFEEKSRGGVILTRLEDSFLSTDNCESGFYRKIWIRKFDDSKGKRPEREKLLALYEQNKGISFEQSKWRFILSALDLRMFGKDLLSKKDTPPVMCSEYIYKIMLDLNYPVSQKQASNEYTPKDIDRMIDHFYDPAIIYKFEDGMFRLK